MCRPGRRSDGRWAVFSGKARVGVAGIYRVINIQFRDALGHFLNTVVRKRIVQGQQRSRQHELFDIGPIREALLDAFDADWRRGDVRLVCNYVQPRESLCCIGSFPGPAADSKALQALDG